MQKSHSRRLNSGVAISLTLVFFVSLLSFASTTVVAKDWSDFASHQRDPAYMLLAQSAVSLEQAVQMARKKSKGRVLSAKTRSVGGHRVHRIRLLDKKGRVLEVEIDATTGERRRMRRSPEQSR